MYSTRVIGFLWCFFLYPSLRPSQICEPSDKHDGLMLSEYVMARFNLTNAISLVKSLELYCGCGTIVVQPIAVPVDNETIPTLNEMNE